LSSVFSCCIFNDFIANAVAGGAVSVNGSGKRGGKLGDRKSRSLYGRGLPKKGISLGLELLLLLTLQCLLFMFF